MTWKHRYAASYSAWQIKTYPAGTKDHGVLSPNYPKVDTSNGLTRMICDFLKWEGWRATRVNTMGRLIDAPEKQASGIVLTTKKWIYGSTRRGSADVSSTIKGKSVMWEIKIGNDKPSEWQLKEQEREIAAGGMYFFVKTPDQFFELYDRIINNKI